MIADLVFVQGRTPLVCNHLCPPVHFVMPISFLFCFANLLNGKIIQGSWSRQGDRLRNTVSPAQHCFARTSSLFPFSTPFVFPSGKKKTSSRHSCGHLSPPAKTQIKY